MGDEKKNLQTSRDFALTVGRFFREIVLSDSIDDQAYNVKDIDPSTGEFITTDGRRIHPRIYLSDVIEYIPKYFLRKNKTS